MPDLADLENANSFPSAIDENSAQQSDSNMQGFLDTDGDYQMVDETSQSIEKTEDDFAQSEETKPGDPDATSLDAENISEDELPAPAKPKVQDAEEVSDEELPGPKMAELPADTEVVSEDELPAEKKKEGKRKHEDYDPCDPTDETDEKKAKTDGEWNFSTIKIVLMLNFLRRQAEISLAGIGEVLESCQIRPRRFQLLDILAPVR